MCVLSALTDLYEAQEFNQLYKTCLFSLEELQFLVADGGTAAVTMHFVLKGSYQLLKIKILCYLKRINIIRILFVILKSLNINRILQLTVL